jgi:predicted RecB family nuclease
MYDKVLLPVVEYELFFDIEDDPTQEFVYMHGIYERHREKERYLDFTASELSVNAEKEAWKKFWDYIHSLPSNNFSVYYYSHHEKTTYHRLQKKYPDIISEAEVTDFFGNPNIIDLYKIVLKSTDWPADD